VVGLRRARAGSGGLGRAQAGSGELRLRRAQAGSGGLRLRRARAGCLLLAACCVLRTGSDEGARPKLVEDDRLQLGRVDGDKESRGRA
jgi:hypothetical protein